VGGMPDAWNVDRHIDGKRSSRGAERLIAELADRQHGVVTRRQLSGLGLTGDAIDKRLRACRLLPLYRSVYVLGHHNRSRETAWMAAVLAGGAGSVLCDRSAGAHWGVCGGGTGVHVTVPGKRRRRAGIEFHRRRLPPDETTTKDGIPVTTVPRTLFDLAAILDMRQLERALNEAEVLRLWDELSLLDLLHRYPRRPGTRNLKKVLQARSEGATMTRSDLEVFFLQFADRYGLPRPETNAIVEGFEVDCVWRRERLVIEVDAWSTHGTRAAFERDRERSRILQAAGWRCVAVTRLQLRHKAGDLARDVHRLLAAVTLAA
jgi:very-short-patch-repair endonuclease